MQRFTILSATTILATAAAPSLAAIMLTTTYTQDFNTLPNSPNTTAQAAANTWTNDSTISGWHATGQDWNSGLAVSAGSSDVLSTNSSGVASLGTLAATDRALSPAKRNRTSYIGAEFSNQTGGLITQLQVAYTGEQWRLNSTGPYEPLVFAYSTNPHISPGYCSGAMARRPRPL